MAANSLKHYDFSGYATRNDLRCSDGLTIRRNAFKHQNGAQVPLCYQHNHTDIAQVIGHCILENRKDGVYCYGYINNSDNGRHAKELLHSQDIDSLSIWANNLSKRGSDILHGDIKEVSLCLSGANPGAYLIDYAIDAIAQADGYTDIDESRADIYLPIEDQKLDINGGKLPSDLYLMHSDKDDDDDEPEDPDDPENEEEGDEDEEEGKKKKNDDQVAHADTDDDETVEDVLNTLTQKQEKAVAWLYNQISDDSKVEHSDMDEGGDATMAHTNLFETNGIAATDMGPQTYGNVIQHDQMEAMFKGTKQYGGSLKDSVIAHAAEYGIDNIQYLFPDAKTLTNTPDFIKRETEWVSVVLNSTRHTPFTRIKTIHADITEDEARARGYIKGSLKKEEVFGLLKRTTDPQTVYKKQKLDRDDMLDITDFDVVVWLKQEMRLMLDEEIARAILIGDGRAASSEYKISEEHIRSIYNDEDLYSVKVPVPVASDATDDQKGKMFIRTAVKSRKNYKGSGNPTLFTTEDELTNMLLIEDGIGRRLYDTEEKLRTALRVNRIVTVEVMEGITRTDDEGNTLALAGIIVNLNDYNVGADKGGQTTFFEDFDIDYNQQKYLLETRISGALIKPFSALVLEYKTGSGEDVTYTYTPVENPSGDPSEQGWYELIGGQYVLTTDTEVDEDKTYYVRSES